MTKKFANINYIHLILFFSLLFRLYQLTSPIMGAQSWRQADTAAMARNFYENGYNFFYPQIDWGGNSAGYVETEFPIYPYFVSLFYNFFGVSDIIGRLISIVFSLITIYFVYKLVLKLVDEKTALWTTFTYSILATVVFYGRVFMGEPLLVMCIVIGVYLFIEWTENEKFTSYIFSLLFISLACLIKPPSLYIGLPLLFIWRGIYGKKVFSNIKILLYAFIVFLSVFIWYYHAHQIYLTTGLTFNIWEYGTDKWGNWDFIFTWDYFNSVFFRTIAEKHLTWTGFIIFVVGMIAFRKDKRLKLFYVWLLAALIYLIIVARGNYAHDYYQLPILVPITIFLGMVFSKYFNKRPLSNWKSGLLTIGLVGMLGLGFARYYDYIKREDLTDPKYKLSQLVKYKTENNALIITVSDYDPMLLYLSHRKGWQCSAQQVTDLFIRERVSKGAKYLVGNNKDFSKESFERLSNLNFSFLYNDGESFILDIR